MNNSERKTYPQLPLTHWWQLRKLFRTKIPKILSTSYLSASLDMSVESARANIIPHLKHIGLIDDECATIEEKAKKWRDDEQYKEFCDEIIEEVYDDDLLAIHEPWENIDKVSRWFSNKTGKGEVAVRKMTSFYVMLARREIDETITVKPQTKSESKKSSARKQKTANKKAQLVKEDTFKPAINESFCNAPAIHLNIQIHISPNSSPEQIDQIFASIKKHIYPKE